MSAGSPVITVLPKNQRADKARFRERQRQIDLARARGEDHLGDGAKATHAERRLAKRSAPSSTPAEP